MVLDKIRDAMNEEPSDDPEPTTILPFSPRVAFDVLSNDRRRDVLALLDNLDPGESTTLDDLTEGIAVIETDAESPAELDSQSRKRVYVSLYQTHLPRLVKMGLVEWDWNSNNRIEPTRYVGPLVEAMKEVERVCAEREDS